jgi:hypothetical protein
VYKTNVTLEKSGDYVVIVDSGRVPAKEYELLYTDVTVPSEANADDLYATLLGYVNTTSGGGGGDASAANQVTMISELQDVNTELDNITANTSVSSSSTILTQSTTVISTEVLSSESRIGASFVNLSSSDCYILLGSGTASATNYTVKLSTGVNSIYELPYNYSGVVNVVFSSVSSGNLVITKLV